MEPKGKITRRSLLKGAGALAASAVVPAWQVRAAGADAPAQPAGKDITGELSTYMSEAASRPLPPEVEEEAKQHILDTIAAMISGANLPPAEAAVRFVRAYDGRPVCTVVGTPYLCGPIEAALANGMRAHSDETDDSNAPSHSHPGCSIVSATLAAGEKFGISGSHFVRAVTLGYDVGPRVTLTLGGLQYQIQTHRSTHSIAGTFGSCAAAGSAASLDARQMRWVLDYAAQQASGIAAWMRDKQHIEKSLVFAGFTARNGVTTALLIHAGATGIHDVFFGSDNFFEAFGPNANPEGLIDGLGKRYEIAETNIKKWTVGSPVQAALDALQRLMKQHHFTAKDVKAVYAHLGPREARTVNNRNMPDICLQYLLAVMLLDGTVTFHASHDDKNMHNPAVVANRAKIHLIADKALEKYYPTLIAVVDVVLNNGDHFSQRVDAVRGTVANPMSHDEVAAKARDLMTPFLGKDQTNRLIDAVFHLEKVTDIRQLRPLLQHG